MINKLKEILKNSSYEITMVFQDKTIITQRKNNKKVKSVNKIEIEVLCLKNNINFKNIFQNKNGEIVINLKEC